MYDVFLDNEGTVALHNFREQHCPGGLGGRVLDPSKTLIHVLTCKGPLFILSLHVAGAFYAALHLCHSAKCSLLSPASPQSPRSSFSTPTLSMAFLSTNPSIYLK